jgi:ABC-type antimicrobial peptide transport system ATPase subunit
VQANLQTLLQPCTWHKNHVLVNVICKVFKHSRDLVYETRTLTNSECAKVQASILVTQEPRCTIVNVPGASKPSGWSLAHDRKVLHNCECTRLQEELTHQW